ncbi:MAG: bifunctional phosphoserine phosphatase/homoserine phosphotransferase ThrH [Oscillospiraceae bacterium]|nr:bifunctional phosphoserine phosphatase/homoserine phosphotransferase ThrH [Oscillospiraceae bacterium]
MTIVCLDMEGVLMPEFWPAFGKVTGIKEFDLTTSDEPDYDKLMKMRIEAMRRNNLGIKEIQETLKKIEPVEGAREFLDKLRKITQVIILSDTFEQFGMVIMEKLNWPTLICNTLEISEDGFITDYKMRSDNTKYDTVKALQSIGYNTVVSGDSYNDIGMIKASKAGFLFRSTDRIKSEYPEIPTCETFEELFEAIKKELD